MAAKSLFKWMGLVADIDRRYEYGKRFLSDLPAVGRLIARTFLQGNGGEGEKKNIYISFAPADR